MKQQGASQAVEESQSTVEGSRRILRHATSWFPSGSAKKHITAEFLGSFLLHFVGAACIINSLDPTLNGTNYADHHGQTGLLTAALGNGFIVATTLYCTGGENGSGGKLNPAISIGLYAAKRLRTSTFAAELVAQFIGATLGGLAVRGALPESNISYTGQLATFKVEGSLHHDALRIFVWEVLTTALVVFVYFATAVDRHNLVYTRTMFPLAVGLATAVGIFAGGPYAGVCMNPARAVAAAVSYWDVSRLWLYIAGGVVGGMLGAAMHVRIFFGDVNGAMLTEGSAFEGVRQEKKDFERQNFVQYFIVDSVKRSPTDRHMFDVVGRVCYPELRDSTCVVQGILSADGRALRLTEKGGKFDGAVTHGYMPDTGHIAAVQSHSNGVPLAYVRLVLMQRSAARRLIAQLESESKPANPVVKPAMDYYADRAPDWGRGSPDPPAPPPNTSRVHHSLV